MTWGNCAGPRFHSRLEKEISAHMRGGPQLPHGSPALLFCIDQEPWLCGPASQRVCPSTPSVGRKLREHFGECNHVTVFALSM